MMFNKKTGLTFVCIFFFFAILGYFREYVFLNVNEQLYKLYFGNYEYELPGILQLLSSLSYSQLYYSKFLITFIFVVLYFTIASLSFRLLFADKNYLKPLLLIYLPILIISLGFYLFGYFSGQLEKGYFVARLLIGVLQSPVVFMILFFGILLQSTSVSKKEA